MEQPDLIARALRFLFTISGLTIPADERLARVPAATRLRLSIRQLTERTRLSVMLSIVGPIPAVATYIVFRNRESAPVCTTALVWILGTYAVLFATARRWQSLEDKVTNYRRYSRLLQVVLVTLGCAWGSMVICGVFFGGDVQRTVAYMLAAGLVSTAMIPGPAKYALAFWTPTISILIISIIITPYFSTPILVTVVSYALFTIYTILIVSKELARREYGMWLTSAHAQTIDLLLRDFREGSDAFLWESNAVGEVKGLPNGCDLLPPNDKDTDVSITTLLRLLERRVRFTDRAALIGLRNRISAHEAFKDIVVRVDKQDGTHSWNVAGKPLFDEDGGFFGYRGLCTNVTDREEYRRQLEFAAKRDYLTESFNRSTFLEFLDSLSQSTARPSSALLCVDLDEFKSVNDEFGHAIGDSLLKAVVKRMLSCVRSDDRVFRLGGDEFAVAIPGGDRAEAAAVATRIIERVSMPFNFGNASIRIGASIGIALIEPGGAPGHIAHKSADLALYRAKSEGRRTFRFAGSDLQTQFNGGVSMERELSHALSRGQIDFVYQPIVDIRSGVIVSAEVLLRWTHPVLGTILPKVFIPLLEQSGEIEEVGVFVIERAIAIAAQIPDGVRLAINLSPFQLGDRGLCDVIGRSLVDQNVSASKIEFEITETKLLDGDVDKQGILAGIQDLGCRICLDDFGTGYASLRILEEFPFDKVKIDGSFVNAERTSQRERRILEAMIQLGRSLDVTVTGEGIESREQLEELVELGCDEGQGFFLFEPMTFDRLIEVILQNNLPSSSGTGRPVRD